MRGEIDLEILRFSVEELLGSHLAIGRTWFSRELRYDPQQHVLWRACDFQAYLALYHVKASLRHRLQTTINLFLNGKGLNFFIEPTDDIDGLVIYLRDSVVVTVCTSLCIAAKVLRKEANQKDVVRKECMAYNLLPEFVPSILDYNLATQPGHLDYVVSRFAPNTCPVTPKEWHTVLPKLFDALFICYQRSDFKKITVIELINHALDMLEKYKEPSEFFELCSGIIHDVCNVCATFEDAQLWQTFVHGDLTWDCVHRDGDTISIIDWGNSGYKNVFFDLFIQEFYRATPDFWRNVLTADSFDFLYKYFFGAFHTFYQNLTERIDADFSLFNVKANLLISLLEKSVDSFLRYRVVNEVEGSKFCQHIRGIVDLLKIAY